MHFQRSRFVQDIIGELARYWLVSCLTYFLAVGAELEVIKTLLEIYIIGLPIFLVLSFTGVLSAALYLFALNRWQWERPVYYIGFGEYEQRLKRLSLTDLTPTDVELLRLHAEEHHQQAFRR